MSLHSTASISRFCVDLRAARKRQSLQEDKNPSAESPAEFYVDLKAARQRQSPQEDKNPSAEKQAEWKNKSDKYSMSLHSTASASRFCVNLRADMQRQSLQKDKNPTVAESEAVDDFLLNQAQDRTHDKQFKRLSAANPALTANNSSPHIHWKTGKPLQRFQDFWDSWSAVFQVSAED